ncbi:MAG: hypothetical protein LBR76_08055 [Oscillospiraceae bacterium]|jgi:hypothetical protein|nr:hypothetical protein [Oscillospiraceae bacterium]
MAFLAYYLHWPRSEVMALAHGERQEWCARVSGINKELSGSPDNIFEV